MYLPRRVNFEKGGRGLGKTALQKLQLISVGVVRKTSIWHVEAIRFQVLGQESVSLAGQFLATWTCGWGGFFFLVRLAPPEADLHHAMLEERGGDTSSRRGLCDRAFGCVPHARITQGVQRCRISTET